MLWCWQASVGGRHSEELQVHIYQHSTSCRSGFTPPSRPSSYQCKISSRVQDARSCCASKIPQLFLSCPDGKLTKTEEFIPVLVGMLRRLRRSCLTQNSTFYHMPKDKVWLVWQGWQRAGARTPGVCQACWIVRCKLSQWLLPKFVSKLKMTHGHVLFSHFVLATHSSIQRLVHTQRDTQRSPSCSWVWNQQTVFFNAWLIFQNRTGTGLIQILILVHLWYIFETFLRLKHPFSWRKKGILLNGGRYTIP